MSNQLQEHVPRVFDLKELKELLRLSPTGYIAARTLLRALVRCRPCPRFQYNTNFLFFHSFPRLLSHCFRSLDCSPCPCWSRLDIAHLFSTPLYAYVSPQHQTKHQTVYIIVCYHVILLPCFRVRISYLYELEHSESQSVQTTDDYGITSLTPSQNNR